MAAISALYRLVVVNPAAASPFEPGDSTVSDEHFWVTSSRDSGQHNYISTPPDDDADRLDLLTAEVEEGETEIGISDVYQGGGTVGTPATVSDSLDPTSFYTNWLFETNWQSAVGFAGNQDGPEGDYAVQIPAQILSAPANAYRQYARTFSGFTPGAVYRVVADCRQMNRVSPAAGFLPPGGGIRTLLRATVDAGTTEVQGAAYNVVAGWNSSNEPWTTLTAQVTVGASGTIRVAWGWISPLGDFIITGVEFDRIRITQVSAPSLSPGRYVTQFAADAEARWQQQGRRAYLEGSVDGGTTWRLLRSGYVTRQRMPRAQEWFLTIGGSRRRERTIPVGRLSRLVGQSYATFRPTALVGGPILGGVSQGGLPGVLEDPEIRARRFFVSENRAATATQAGFVAIVQAEPLFPSWMEPPLTPQGAGNTPRTEMDLLNEMADAFYYDTHTGVLSGSSIHRGWFPSLAVNLYDPATLDLVSAQRPLAVTTDITTRGRLIAGRRIYLGWSMTNPDAVAPVGQQFLVEIVPDNPTPEFPLWASDHPVNIIGMALELCGLTVDVGSITAARQALGEDLYANLQFEDPDQSVGEWVDERCAFLGLAVVNGDSENARRIVVTRDRPAVTSLTTITDADLRGFAGGDAFSLAESSRRNVMKATMRQFVRWTSGMDAQRPYTMLLPFDAPVEQFFDTGEDEALQSGEQTVHMRWPGSLGLRLHNTTQSPTPFNGYDFITAIAYRLFDRHGRGTPVHELALAGPAPVGLGDIILNGTSYVPNPQPNRTPTAQRGGLRVMRVVGVTQTPAGDDLVCIDEGHGQPYPTSFGLSTAPASWAAPGTFVLDVTLTGCLQLAADEALVDLYVGLTANTSASPTDTGVHLKTINLRGVTTDSLTVGLGPFPLGVVVWVRGEAWQWGGARSASTYWTSTNGPDTSGNPGGGPGGTPGSLPPPVTPPGPAGDISTLAADVLESNYIDLSWTNTDAYNRVRVRHRESGTAQWVGSPLLAPGSTTYRLTPLTPDTTYSVEVTLLDPVSGALVGTLLTDDFTTLTAIAGNPITLPVPSSPRAFSGIIPGLALAVDAIGVAVVAEPVPGLAGRPYALVFEMAVETAVGSGIPGDFPSDLTGGEPFGGPFQQSRSAVPGDNTAYWLVPRENENPALRRKRYFRVRAWSSAYTPSDWTPLVEAVPYVEKLLAPPGGVTHVISHANVDGTGATGVDGVTGYFDLAAANAATLWSVQANWHERVRLYTDEASRDADLSRVIGDTYAPGQGLAFEVVLPTAAGSFSLTPGPQPVFGPAVNGSLRIWYTVANLSDPGIAADVLVHLQFTLT